MSEKSERETYSNTPGPVSLPQLTFLSPVPAPAASAAGGGPSLPLQLFQPSWEGWGARLLGPPGLPPLPQRRSPLLPRSLLFWGRASQWAMRLRGLVWEPGNSPIPRPTVLATVPVRTDVARVSSAIHSLPSCSSSSSGLLFQLQPAGPARLRAAMEDTQLHIIEQPLPGYSDAGDQGSSSMGAPAAAAAEEPSGAGSEELIKSDQVNGVLVLSLLDKIIGAVDQIQLTQAQLEERQAEMEGAVQSIQGELSKLGKAHATTSNTVSKLLEKVRKVSVNVKTVRGSLERQAGQIKKLEVNEAELLRRRNFKVMIYQVSWRADRAQRPTFPLTGAWGGGSRPWRGSSASLAPLGGPSLLPVRVAGVGCRGVGGGLLERAEGRALHSAPPLLPRPLPPVSNA